MGRTIRYDNSWDGSPTDSTIVQYRLKKQKKKAAKRKGTIRGTQAMMLNTDINISSTGPLTIT